MLLKIFIDDGKLSSINLEALDISSLKLDAFNPGKGSTESCNPGEESTECCGQGDGSCKSNTREPLTKSDILSLVCYSCMRTVSSFKDAGRIPLNLQQQVQKSRNRNAMKNEIQDFLL